MNKPYQVVVTFGDLTVAPTDVRVAALSSKGSLELPEVDEAGNISHRFLDELRAADLTPSDMRSRVLFVTEKVADTAELVAAYALTSFFAGRRVDFQVGDVLTFATPIDERSRSLADAGRPSDPADEVLVGAEREGVQSVRLDVAPSAADVAAVRYARRVTLTAPEQAAASLISYLLVAGIRARGNTERLPGLVLADGTTIDLDLFRRAAAQLRRSAKVVDLAQIADRVAPSARARQMLSACAVPAPVVMVALGTTSPGNGFWHCPRPTRHRNGDANASMRVEQSRVRCFRCDGEMVDVVRLVADVRDCSFTEAAEWILDDVAPRQAELAAQVPADAVLEADQL